ncbi:MAG TPA: bifunctional riboflavin kinase/FAD synthetase [Candidatus Kryptonia bacterium]|nr:bifunctional riboflavin kinase/FAD synthetase [Candidatus Kryptonia bacterium]
MLVLRHLERIARRPLPPVVTLGNFDGVHRGHQEILRRTVAAARAADCEAVAITFWPHPSQVLAPARGTALITSLRQRIEQIAACGIDVIVAQRFSRRFATVTAEDFVKRLIHQRLGAQRVVVGHRVSFGHNRGGNAEVLRHLAGEVGLKVEVVEPVKVEDHLVSSSAVRAALRSGDLDHVRRLLGRAHSIAGRVIHGHHRGRTIGFPTANLRLRGDRGGMLPPDGVYAVRLGWRNQWYPAIANIGFNPTFGDEQRSLETHVFDFDGDLYRQRVEVAFVERLRGEVKFGDAPALAAQIQRDVAAARAALAHESKP